MPGFDPTTILLLLGVVALAYFMLIRPQQKRAKEQRDLMAALKAGDRVMTISGIVGTIRYLGEKQAIIEISPGVEMTVVKAAIETNRWTTDSSTPTKGPSATPTPSISTTQRAQTPTTAPARTRASSRQHVSSVEEDVATSKQQAHPLRTLIILFAVIAGLFTIMAVNNVWSSQAGP